MIIHLFGLYQCDLNIQDLRSSQKGTEMFCVSPIYMITLRLWFRHSKIAYNTVNDKSFAVCKRYRNKVGFLFYKRATSTMKSIVD